MKFDTISEAAHEWVRGFNAFPQDMISRLMNGNIDEWREVTKPSEDCRVYVYNASSEGEITEVLEDRSYRIELDGGG